MEITVYSKNPRKGAKLLLGLLYDRRGSSTPRPRTKATSFWVMAQSWQREQDPQKPRGCQAGPIPSPQCPLGVGVGGPTSHHPSRGALRLSAPSRLGKGVVFLPRFSRKAQRPAQYHSVLARLEVFPPSL